MYSSSTRARTSTPGPERRGAGRRSRRFAVRPRFSLGTGNYGCGMGRTAVTAATFRGAEGRVRQQVKVGVEGIPL